jgi:dihydroflavonol-4-reductase
MTKPVLVTGGSGMLGAHILRHLLSAGFTDITATYHQHENNIPADLREYIRWEPLALPDLGAVNDLVQGHAYVIHNAGFISYRKSDKATLLDVNQEGTRQIANACLAEQTEHLIYIGSIASLGKEKNGVTLNELSPWLDNGFSTNYGLSKYLGELEVWRAHGEGLPVSVVLPSLVIGSGPMASTSMQMVHRVEHAPPFYPGGQTGFIAANDIASFITMLLQKEITGERWLMSAADLSYQKLYAIIQEALGAQRKFRMAPKVLSGIYLRLSSLFSSQRLGPELLNQTYATFFYDGKKTLRVEGFEYSDVEVALKRLVEEYREISHATTQRSQR